MRVPERLLIGVGIGFGVHYIGELMSATNSPHGLAAAFYAGCLIVMWSWVMWLIED